MDPQWHTFTRFLADMGCRPPGTTIDRIDNTKGYYPGNCRWATPAQQAANRYTTRLRPREPAQIRWLHEMGYRNCEIARFFNISQQLCHRVIKGLVWREVR